MQSISSALDGVMNLRVLSFLAILTFLVVCLHTTEVQAGQAIGCFVCTSINRSEPDCEDTFNNTGRFYHTNCFAPRKKRYGVFPATECIKLKGTIAASGETVLVRTCVVDNGDVNSETEIGRSNHCGLIDYILYNSKHMSGCILSCNTDGCNSAHKKAPDKYFLISMTVLSTLLYRQWSRLFR